MSKVFEDEDDRQKARAVLAALFTAATISRRPVPATELDAVAAGAVAIADALIARLEATP